MNSINNDLSNKEKQFLYILADYRILTTKQMSYLNEVGLRATQKTAKSLNEKEVIHQSYGNFSTQKGRPETYCFISEKGIKALKQDESLKIYLKSSQNLDKEKLNIKHEILINWFRIHLLNVDRQIDALKTEFLSTNTLFLPKRKNGAPLIADSVEIDNYNKWFVPDGVFSIKSNKQNKSLLFFLEADMSTESLSSNNKTNTTIAHKLKCYYAYFLNLGYKRYQKKWMDEFNGFRVLFLCNTARRKELICRYMDSFDKYNFVWMTDALQLHQNGLAANIWIRGGNRHESLKSILGPSLSFISALKNNQ